VAIVAVGWALLCFDIASVQAAPKKEPGYSALLYSADAFLPLDIRQVEARSPDNTAGDVLVAVWPVLGWLAAGLGAAALSGLIRRE
jgi:hypothetical protein